MTNKKVIRVILLLATIHCLEYNPASGQTDASLPGLIVLQNSKFQTGHLEFVSGASIRSTVKCIPTTSDANGKFTLVFADKPIGDAATVIVARDGFEVVNEKELESASVVGRLSPLKVVMCKQGTVYSNKMRYYQISDSVIQKTYEKRYDALLKKEGHDYEEVIKSLSLEMKRQIRDLNDAMEMLKEQLAIQKKQVRDVVDQFVVENLDDESENYQLAFMAFTRGEIDSALYILDKVDLAKRLDANTKMISKEDSIIQDLKENVADKKEQIRQDIGEALLDARMHKLKYQFDKARASYELVLKYDSTNVYDIMEYAGFLNDINDFKRESQVNQKAIQLYKRLANTNAVMKKNYGIALTNDGLLNARLGNFDLGESEYLTAIQVFSELSYGDPQHNANVARAKGLLGQLYEQKNDNKKAEKYLKGSLESYKSLAKTDSYYYQKDVGLGNLFLGLFYWGKQNQLALKYLKDAYDIFNSYTEESGSYEPQTLGMIGKDMAEIYLQTEDLNHAEQYYFLTDSLFKKALKDNPLRYKQDIADIQIGLGEVYTKRKTYDKAEKCLAKSLEIYQEISLNDSNAFKRKIAEIKKLTGELYRYSNQYEKAEIYYHQALMLNRELENRFKEDESDRAKIYTVLAYLYWDKKDYPNAEKSMMSALALYKYLDSADASFEADLAGAYNELGRVYKVMEDYKKCEISYLKALQIYLDLNKTDSLFYQTYIAMMHNNIGLLYKSEKKYADAESEMLKALTIRANLFKKDSSFETELAETEMNLGSLYRSMGEFKKSENAYARALSIYRKHLSESLEYYGEKLGNLQVDIAFMFKDAKDYVRAEDAFVSSIQTKRQLAGLNAEEYNKALYITQADLISLYQNMVDSFKTEPLRLKYRQQIDSLYIALNAKYNSKGGRSQIDAGTCGNLSWHLLFVNKYKEAETAAGWGLAIDSSEIWITTNRCHALLFQDRYDEALKEYLALKDKKDDGDGRQYKLIFLEDLDNLEKAGVTCRDLKKIRQVLNQ